MENTFLDFTPADCISHTSLNSLESIIHETEARLKNSDHLTLPLTTELELLRQLTEFELGRFLIQNKGLNGYFTHYIISGNHEHVPHNSLEYWVLNHAPAVKATQERFYIFQAEIQKRLATGTTLASIPCGLMNDLLSLDYSHAHDVNLVGIDIDPKSLELAQNNIGRLKPPANTTLALKDAWSIDASNQFDLITSNGLNIYEPSEERVTTLYQKFYSALRPEGYLITSFLTPPPTLSPSSTWRNYEVKDILQQKAIFSDILQVKWQVFRTEDQTRAQLEHAGFKVLDVIYDSQGMFPTVIAQK
jgi:SAM-dependent methyltransferase